MLTYGQHSTDKLQLNFIKNMRIFMKKMHLKMSSAKFPRILFRPQCVKDMLKITNWFLSTKKYRSNHNKHWHKLWCNDSMVCIVQLPQRTCKWQDVYIPENKIYKLRSVRNTRLYFQGWGKFVCNKYGTLTTSLTHKQLEMQGCILSTVATDGLVVKHQAISIHSIE